MDNPLVQPDIGLFIWTLITFGVLLLLLNRFAWKPLLRALDERRDAIRQSLDEAEQARQQSQQASEEAERILGQARAEADAIIAARRADAAKLQEELHQQARTEADTIIANAQQEIRRQTDRAIAQIRGEAVDIALLVASRLIQRNLSADDNDRLIRDALKEIQARPG